MRSASPHSSEYVQPRPSPDNAGRCGLAAACAATVANTVLPSPNGDSIGLARLLDIPVPGGRVMDHWTSFPLGFQLDHLRVEIGGKKILRAPSKKFIGSRTEALDPRSSRAPKALGDISQSLLCGFPRPDHIECHVLDHVLLPAHRLAPTKLEQDVTGRQVVFFPIPLGEQKER